MRSEPPPNSALSSWLISFHGYNPDDESRREVIFALGNGMFVTRAASADSGTHEAHYPGTYRAGCYNRAVSHIAGEKEENESLVRLPNWLPLTFRIENGPWFQLDNVELVDYRHTLDLRAGTTQREFTFTDNSDRRTWVRESRLVSMANPHLAGLRLELEPQNWSGTIEVKSGIDGNVVNANVPRYADYERHHLAVADSGTAAPNQLWLKSRTLQSGVEIVQVVRTTIDTASVSSNKVQESCDCRVIRSSETIASQFCAPATCGQAVTTEKVVALYTSLDPGVEDLLGAASRAVTAAGSYAQLRDRHECAWEQLWHRAALKPEQDRVARALQLHSFHILQTVSPHTAELDVGVPARGWHGEGYRGHVFWDELFVLPYLNFRFQELAKSLLLYRYRRLDAARSAARKAGYRGAMYPWRSASDGAEVTPQHQKNLLSGHWMRDPTQLQRHIGSAIAFNVWHYYLVTDDIDFLSGYGAELILEIGRFWASVAQYSSATGRYEIRGVIGPDEYQTSYPDRSEAGLDNNAYTNVTAVWTLCRALEVLDHLPAQRRMELIDSLELNQEEFALWDRVSRNMYVAFHHDGVISQFEGFEQLRSFSRDDLPPSVESSRIDWALEAIGETADGYKITKQADTLTLFYLFSQRELRELFARMGYHLEHGALERTADYYLARTTHRSSLSRITYAGALAHIDLGKSWELYQQGLKTDLEALKGESIAEGVHLGAMGGTLDILQRRYLGIQPCREGLEVFPAMPAQLGKVSMSLIFRGNYLKIFASVDGVSMRSHAGNREDIQLVHVAGRSLLQPGQEVTVKPSPKPERASL